MKSNILIGSALLMAALPSAALAEPVLLISIDGLQPADVIEASRRKNAGSTSRTLNASSRKAAMPKAYAASCQR